MNVLEPIGALLVEAVNPVAQCLAVHPANPGGPSRLIPSATAASDRSRRLCRTSFVLVASRRNAPAE